MKRKWFVTLLAFNRAESKGKSIKGSIKRIVIPSEPMGAFCRNRKRVNREVGGKGQRNWSRGKGCIRAGGLQAARDEVSMRVLEGVASVRKGRAMVSCVKRGGVVKGSELRSVYPIGLMHCTSIALVGGGTITQAKWCSAVLRKAWTRVADGKAGK